MAPWSIARERGLDLSGPQAALRDARLVGGIASVVLVWALAGALLPIAARGTSAQVVLLGILPLLALGVALLLLRPEGARVAGGALLTSGLALAIAGHAVGPRGAEMRSLLPPDAFELAGLPRGLAVALMLLLLTALPLVVAARAHAARLAIDATGARVRSTGLALLALPARDADELGAPAGAGRWAAAALARLAEGYHVPGRLLVEGAAAAASRIATRRLAVQHVHADVPLHHLVPALEAAGFTVQGDGRGILARLPDDGEVRIRATRLGWPRVRADAMLAIDGPRDAVRRARRVLLEDVAHLARFAWSAQGRRWELRLNALAADAREARSVEERSVLLEETDRLLAVLARRHLCDDEWALLVAWKGQRLRAALNAALLHEAPGPKRADRAAAPAPALAPELAHVMAAGGLDAIGRATFQPTWILPVWSPWGEREIVVDARTGSHDPDASRALLRAMDARAPSPFLDVARRAAFEPAPTPTAALLRSVRASLPPALRLEGAAVEAPLECVYVPFVPGAEGPVNGVTGEAGGQGSAKPAAPAAPGA